MLRQLLATCDNSVRGRRDRALLLFGFVGALRRSDWCPSILTMSPSSPTGSGCAFAAARLTKQGREDGTASIKQRQIDDVSHMVVATIALMQMIAAVVDRQHAAQMSGSRTAWSKSITASNPSPCRIQAFTVCRTASRAGFHAPGKKVSFSKGVIVPPKILMPRAWARSVSASARRSWLARSPLPPAWPSGCASRWCPAAR